MFIMKWIRRGYASEGEKCRHSILPRSKTAVSGTQETKRSLSTRTITPRHLRCWSIRESLDSVRHPGCGIYSCGIRVAAARSTLMRSANWTSMPLAQSKSEGAYSMRARSPGERLLDRDQERHAGWTPRFSAPRKPVGRGGSARPLEMAGVENTGSLRRRPFSGRRAARLSKTVTRQQVHRIAPSE